MITTIGELLPSAAAVALSPFPVIAIVVVLGAPEARRNGVAFAGGWVLGLAALTGVLTTLAGGASSPGHDSSALAWARVAVAVGLLALAVKKWRSRPVGDEPPTAPGWMASLDDLSGRRALVTGLALAGINPKNIALTLAAVTAVAGVGLDDRDRAVAMAVYVGLGSVTVVGAVAAHLAVGDRAAAPLAAAKRFMIHNNTLIIIAVLVLLAVMIGGEGVAHLRR